MQHSRHSASFGGVHVLNIKARDLQYQRGDNACTWSLSGSSFKLEIMSSSELHLLSFFHALCILRRRVRHWFADLWLKLWKGRARTDRHRQTDTQVVGKTTTAADVELHFLVDCWTERYPKVFSNQPIWTSSGRNISPWWTTDMVQKFYFRAPMLRSASADTSTTRLSK